MVRYVIDYIAVLGPAYLAGPLKGMRSNMIGARPADINKVAIG